jgi:hypothetical protein
MQYNTMNHKEGLLIEEMMIEYYVRLTTTNPKTWTAGHFQECLFFFGWQLTFPGVI